MFGAFPVFSLISLLFIGLIIVVIMETQKIARQEPQKNTFLRLYLLIISIIAIGGATISLGFFIYPTIQKAIITDQEYAINNRKYSNCKEPKYMPVTTKEGVQDETIDPTEEEIAKCQEDAIQEATKERSYEYKSGITIALSRFILFTILFVTHFPFFIRHNKEK